MPTNTLLPNIIRPEPIVCFLRIIRINIVLNNTRKMCFSHVQLSIRGTTLIYNTIHEIKLDVCRLGGAETEPSSEVFSSFDKHFKNMLQITAPESSNKFKKLARTGFLSKLAKNWTIFAQPMKGKESVNKI
jgi:hypothetical protein